MKPTSPTVSIIIVNYNTRQLTLDCLKSVFQHTAGIPFEVTVVDNASMDDSVEQIREAFPDVRLIASPVNIGFGPANNVGIRASAAPYVFLLNSDTKFPHNALGEFLEFMEKPEHADVACCGGQLLNTDETLQASYGHFPSVAQIVFDQFELRRLLPGFYTRRLAVAVDDPAPETRDVPYTSGADMFLRRSAVEQAGLFDERFFLYFEETDLCFRLHSRGWRCVFHPKARIVHLFGASSKGQPLHRMRLFKQSELLFFEKNHGKITRLLVKVLYMKGYAIRWLITWNRYYLDMLRIIRTV